MKTHLIKIFGNIGDAICAEPFIREFIRRHKHQHIAIQSKAPDIYRPMKGISESFHFFDRVQRRDYDKYWYALTPIDQHINSYFDRYRYEIKSKVPCITPSVHYKLPGYLFQKPIICVSTGATKGMRCWEHSRWQELVSLLNHRYSIIHLGDNEEPLKNIDISLVNKTTLPEAASILSQSGLLVSIDSGLHHLAAAVGKKTVVLFGPIDPEIRTHEGLTIPITVNNCRECWPNYGTKKVCERQSCMDIPVQTVYKKIIQIFLDKQ